MTQNQAIDAYLINKMQGNILLQKNIKKAQEVRRFAANDVYETFHKKTLRLTDIGYTQMQTDMIPFAQFDNIWISETEKNFLNCWCDEYWYYTERFATLTFFGGSKYVSLLAMLAEAKNHNKREIFNAVVFKGEKNNVYDR